MGFTVPLVLSALGEAASRFLNSNLLKGIGALNTALSLIDRAKGLSKDEKHQTKAIVRRLGEAVQVRMEQKNSEADRQAYLGAATSAEIVLEKLLKSKETLVQAARCDADVLLAYIDDNGGSAMQREVDQKAEGLFNDLLTIVADGLAGLAQTSQDFLRNALLVALDNQEALMELVQGHRQDLSMVRKALEEIREGTSAGGELLARVSQALEIVSAGTKARPVSEGQGRPIRFGSPPGRAAGFIDREEQAKLDAALGRPEPRDRRDEALKPVCDTDAGRSVDGGGFSSDGDNADSWSVGVPVVVCGMRGVGKSQLAAAYARECEKAGWSFVAWMDASSREALVAGLAGLAVEMGIDDGKGDPDAAACRCVNRLNSGEGDRLLVFDNVDDFDDLAGLVPRSDGLRVLVTTTMARLDPGAGILVPVGMFTRPQSVDFIVERTGTGDPTSAARLAGALGDLPVALAQAAGTIEVNGYSTIDEYLAELSEYRLDEVVDRLPGDDYPVLVHAALRMACRSALDMLADKDRTSGQEGLPRAAAASVQLATLALLAPSGVPRPWLHRIGTRLPIARQALGALAAHCICTPSQDGRYVRIHGLQGRVLREDYMRQPEVFADLEGAVVDLLKGIDIDKADTDDAQRADALDMADQLRAIAEQQQGQAHHSPHEAHIDLSSVVDIVNNTIYFLTAMGRPQTALTLKDTVTMLTDALGPDHPHTLTTRNNLATAHQQAGHLQKAIDMYEALLADRTRLLGPDHPHTLLARNNLATAHHAAGHLPTAIDMYEALLPDMTRLLGPDHPHTLLARNNLANAHQEAGNLQKAIDMYEALLADRTRILGPDHPHTLLARNNLATAHHAAGHLPTAIDMYEALLPDMTRLLGPDHPHTLLARNNLANAHHAAGHLPTAIVMYEALLPDMTRLLGPDHPHTLLARNNLALAHQEAGNLQKAIDMYEALLPDMTRLLGPDHPHTLATRGSLATAHRQAGNVSTAIAMYEALLTDMTRLLGPDHPDTLATRNNLADAHQEAGHVSTAIAMYEALLAGRTRILGPDHPHTLLARNNLAGAHQEAGNLQKAIDMYEAVLADRTRILGPDHPDTLATRNNLAGAHQDAGNLQKAIDMHEALLPDMTRILGPDHPDTLATRNNLAAARKKAQ